MLVCIGGTGTLWRGTIQSSCALCRRGHLHPRSRRLSHRLVATLSHEGGHSETAPPIAVLNRHAATLTTVITKTNAAATSPTPSPVPDPTSGYLSLSLVPILWGTYNPCIRYLYAEADPLDPASLTAVRTILSAGALLLPALVGYLYKQGKEAWSGNRNAAKPDTHTGDTVNVSAARGTATGPHDAHNPTLDVQLASAPDGASESVVVVASVTAPGEELGSSTSSLPAAQRPLLSEPLNSARLGPVLTRTFNNVVLAGLELGILNFLGTALQVQGLHSTSATRAGFLAEITAVLTPLVSYAAGYTIPRQMWLAVGIGLVGSTMVAYDTSLAHETQDGPVAAETTAAASLTTVGTTMPGLASPESTPDVAGALDALAVDVSSVSSIVEGASGLVPTVFDTTVASGASISATLSSAPEPAGSRAGLMLDAVGTSMHAATAASDAIGSAFDAANTLGSEPAIAAARDAAAATVVAVEAASASTAALPLTGGEAYLLLACLFFSVCTVRMGIYAPRMDTVGLAAMKKVGLSSMSVMWMAATNLQNGVAVGSAFTLPDLSSRTPVSVAVLLYSGLGPGALATFLQVSGLSTVPATTAQVIYSMTPLCTAFFAYLILGGEATGSVAWAGGSLIIIAALMAASAQRKQYQYRQEESAET